MVLTYPETQLFIAAQYEQEFHLSFINAALYNVAPLARDLYAVDTDLMLYNDLLNSYLSK